MKLSLEVKYFVLFFYRSMNKLRQNNAHLSKFMKTQSLPRLIAKTTNCLLACLALAAFMGCQSTNYLRSDATAGRLQATAREIRAADANLADATSALNDLL